MRKHRHRNPVTPAEWQEAADSAEMMLALDSCRAYGLIEGGPVVDAERCREILGAAAARGVRPARLDVLVKQFLREQSPRESGSGRT